MTHKIETILMSVACVALLAGMAGIWRVMWSYVDLASRVAGS